MTGSLGGPREGMCRARQFTVRPVWAAPAPGDDKDLGVMPWAELIDRVEQAGGTRPTYDLFDLPTNDDGSWTRIRAVGEGSQP